jgi:hypothetical protein
MGLHDPYIKYPLAAFADSFRKYTSFRSLTVTAIFHSHNLQGRDSLRIERFCPDETYVEEAKSIFKGVMSSLNLTLPHNYLGCRTCVIADTCEVKKGNE